MAVTAREITVDVKVQGPVIDLLRQAADEIERLTDAVRLIRDADPGTGWHSPFAEAVLNGKSVEDAGTYASDVANGDAPAVALDRLTDRLRKAAHRGVPVTVTVPQITPQNPASAP